MDLSSEKILSTWASQSSHFIGEMFDYSQRFIANDSNYLDEYIRFISAQLFMDCHLSSESVLLLIREGKEWDADIITRAVIEGSVKYIYLMSGTDEEVKEKATEYWEILPQFSIIKRSDRLKEFLSIVENPNSPEWKPYRDLLISEEEVARILEKYSKKSQGELSKKWSFTGITKYFNERRSDSLKHLNSLSHGYGTSSHLIHKDGDGVGMVWERFQRNEPRQTAVKLAHSARIVSDMCTLAKLRFLYLLKACKQSSVIISDLEKKYEALFAHLSIGGKAFIETEYDDR